MHHWIYFFKLLSILLFVVAEDTENSSELVKQPELLSKEYISILLFRELWPDIWQTHYNTDSEFFNPFSCGKDKHIFKELIVTPRNCIFWTVFQMDFSKF